MENVNSLVDKKLKTILYSLLYRFKSRTISINKPTTCNRFEIIISLLSPFFRLSWPSLVIIRTRQKVSIILYMVSCSKIILFTPFFIKCFTQRGGLRILEQDTIFAHVILKNVSGFDQFYTVHIF